MLAYSPGPELIVVAAVFVLLFGAKKLPELARSLGRSSTEFKKGLKEGAADADADADEQPEPEQTAEKRSE